MGSAGSLALSSLNGNNGFVLIGVYASSVSGAGDINDDGVDDLVIGASAAYSSSGASFVVFGKPGIGSTGSVSLFSLDGQDGFFLVGINGGSNNAGDLSGASVSGAGDVNGDGIADLIIGAPGVNSRAGAAYMYLGIPLFLY